MCLSKLVRMSRGGGRNPLFASPDATFNRSRSLVPHLQFQFRWTDEGTNVYSMNDDGRMRAPLCAPKSFSGFEENVVVNPRRTSFGANQDPRGDHLRAIRGRWRKTRPSANQAETGKDMEFQRDSSAICHQQGTFEECVSSSR